MSGRSVDVRGRSVWLVEDGDGAPLVYLHGLADLHGASAELLPYHRELAKNFALIAPAHPGCALTDEDEDIDTIDDVVFHYLELFDALKLDCFNLVGSDVGGWIAAEIAVRHPERIAKLSLIGAAGLFVPDEPIADLFWESHPVDGVSLAGLRALLFGDPEQSIARELFPDGRGEIDQELLRYRTYRFLSRIGFNPPYLHHRLLRARLYRFRKPALIIHGADDRLVPRRHAEEYRNGFSDADFQIIDGAGHSPHLEMPEQTARIVVEFLQGGP
jgi:pimeloyl-ACP methyl ester carboxylesterase